MIVRNQPYRLAGRGGDPLVDRLWLLRQLDTTDKHQALLATAAVIGPLLIEVFPKTSDYKDCAIEWGRTAVDDGDVVIRIPAECDLAVDLEPRFQYAVVLNSGGPSGRWPVLHLATDIYNRVRSLLWELNPFIP